MGPELQKQIGKKIQISRSELLWGVVLYGIIMWAAGFVWAGMVL
jgi:hypothetical protein